LFATEVYKMYKLVAEKKGWQFEQLEATLNELGGIR